MKNNTAGIVAITIIVVGLCIFVGWSAWAPNMEADYIGTGLLGVLMPVMAVIAAFVFGVGTGRSMDVADDMEIEPAHRISL